MSLFLGPIHHLMQQRYLFTDAQTAALLDLAGEEGWISAEEKAALTEEYPEQDASALEEIIDSSNIHGWLSQAVEGAERRYAAAVRLVLDGKPERLPRMAEALEDLGRENALPAADDAETAWKLLQNRLLDGMPCDFPFEMQEEAPERVSWKLRACPHADYFAEVPGGSEVFYALRRGLVKGLLSDSPELHYDFTPEGIFALEKG